MYNYIRLTGEVLVFLAAVVALVSAPLNFCNFAYYLGALYVLSAEIMYLYGLNRTQNVI